MSSRLRISEQLIDEADRLLERIEAAGPLNSHSELIGCLNEVEGLLGARKTSLSLLDGTSVVSLAGESSEAIETLSTDPSGEQTVHRIEQTTSTSLIVARGIGINSRLILEAVFDSPDQCADIDDLFIAIADAFAAVVKSQRLEQLDRIVENHRRLNSFCVLLHATRDARLLASQIATDAAAVIGVDRVTVGRRRSGRTAVLAVTGVADINQRANETRFLQTISEGAESADGANWRSSGQLATDLNCTEIAPSTTRNVRVVCDKQAKHEAVFVLECFDEPPTDSSLQDEVLAHASLALTNTWELNERGPVGFLRRIGQASRPLIVLSFLISLAAITLALTLIPVKFEIPCRGHLRPVEQQFVHAPSHGTITFASPNESTVHAGDPLITIHNAQLELEESRIRGEIRTAEARLKSLQADRGESVSRALTSETEVRAQIEGLKQQLEILQRELQVLKVTAQFGGTVYLNDLTHELVGTTVQPGQPLMQLANTNGEWTVQLRIPDKVIRHVLEAEEKDLPVRLMLRTDPSVVFDGQTSSIGTAADIDVRNELSVSASATFQLPSQIDLRPGSEVLAKIDCGSRSLGFVLFRDLIEFVESRILF